MSPSDITALAPARARTLRAPKLSYERGGRELFIVALCLALLAALHVGGMYSDSIHAWTPWMVMACLTAPMVAVSAMFWVAARLLMDAAES
jgi:hypothetical protein